MRPAITESYLLLCEGKQDKVFFQELFRAHVVTNILVECPEEGEEGRGVDAYPEYLNGLKGRTRPNLKGFIITRDADDNAANAFNKVRDWLVSKGYPPPAAVGSIVPAQAHPFDFATMVLLIPPNANAGCLETVLYPAAAVKWQPIVPCVDAFWTCIGPAGRTANQESKIRLRVLLAAAYPRNPNLTLARLWEDAATALSLNDPSFNPVVSAITSFCTNVPP